ncbi:GNAT family N-acetyltransferase [Streptosporangium sp. NPDC005286]|uniref:GNAT family N-acetyltransferase n=1 Tax=Streptosporangium sp. NPDC005286 TaxID=3154463 RepID=UPI0033B88042
MRPGRKDRVRERLLGRSCGWCGRRVPYSGRGRPASYCSKSCCNRAWEVRSAEARLQRDIAVGVVRTEPVREVVRETVVETRFVPVRREPGEPGATSAVPATAQQWLAQLAELAAQLREGELGRQHWYHARLYNAMISAAGYRPWLNTAAQLSVLTAAKYRGRGLARLVASAAVADALVNGLLPQWRARPEPSRRVARALGFREFGSQISLLMKH